MASQENHVETVKLLLANGANLQALTEVRRIVCTRSVANFSTVFMSSVTVIAIEAFYGKRNWFSSACQTASNFIFDCLINSMNMYVI